MKEDKSQHRSDEASNTAFDEFRKKYGASYSCKKLSEKGWGALRKLTELGCDPKTLLNGITIVTDPDHLPLDNNERIPIRPNDDRNETLNGLEMRNLEQIANRGKRILAELAEFQQDAQRLRETLFVQELDRDGFFEIEDLLFQSSSIIEHAKKLPQGADPLLQNTSRVPNEEFQDTIYDHLEKMFKGIFALPEEVRQRGIGTGKHPDYDRQLCSVYQHIKERTGKWRHSLLSTILLDICPHEESKFATRSLEQWLRRLENR